FPVSSSNSHPSWSLVNRISRKEVVAHYGCETWGLARPLGSYVFSFLRETFKNKTQKEKISVLAYTDVGLILVGFKSSPTYYVANPILRQCVKLPLRPLRLLGQRDESFKPGLATRVEKDVLLGYKVVLMDGTNIKTGVLGLLLTCVSNIDPITLNGNIYWFGYNFSSLRYHGEFLVSHDLYEESDLHFGFHNNLERSSDVRTLRFSGEWDSKKNKDNLCELFTLRFVHPRWLHWIPSSPS
ncbi:hypothetical protein EUTSA_v10022100mg, partial [Eutrema salsugineum]